MNSRDEIMGYIDVNLVRIDFFRERLNNLLRKMSSTRQSIAGMDDEITRNKATTDLAEATQSIKNYRELESTKSLSEKERILLDKYSVLDADLDELTPQQLRDISETVVTTAREIDGLLKSQQAFLDETFKKVEGLENMIQGKPSNTISANLENYFDDESMEDEVKVTIIKNTEGGKTIKKTETDQLIMDAQPLHDSLLEGTINLSNQDKADFGRHAFEQVVKQSNGDMEYRYVLQNYMGMQKNKDNVTFDLYKQNLLTALQKDTKNNGLANEIEKILNAKTKDPLSAIDNLMVLNYLNDNDRALYVQNISSLGQTWNLLQNYENTNANTKNRTAELHMARVQVAKDILKQTGNRDEVIKILDGKRDSKHNELASKKKNSFFSSTLFSQNARINEKVFDTMKWTIKKLDSEVKNTAKELGNTSIRRPGK